MSDNPGQYVIIGTIFHRSMTLGNIRASFKTHQVICNTIIIVASSYRAFYCVFDVEPSKEADESLEDPAINRKRPCHKY